MGKLQGAWYVAANVPMDILEKQEGVSSKDITLFAVNDTKSGDYVPVFADPEECDEFVNRISEEYGSNLLFATCSFPSIKEVKDRIYKEFQKQIKIYVKESRK